MPHNVSDRKLAERVAQQRGKLPGWWTLPNGRQEALNTAAGCVARKAVLQGRCNNVDECSRRVTVDLHFWVNAGLGERSTYEIAKAYVCARPAGCGLNLHTTYPEGVPLLCLALENEGHSLYFHCSTCQMSSFGVTAKRLIEMLEKRGVGDGNTGASEVAKLVRPSERCRVCGPTTWFTRIRRS